VLGAAVAIFGCTSTAFASYSITALKESFTGSMADMKHSLTDSVGDMTDSFAEAVTEVQERLALSSLPFSVAQEKLTEEEVRALFVGKTVDTHNRRTKLNSVTYYHPNGQAIQKRLWSKRSGRWTIEDNGKICLAFGDRSMKCRYIVKEGDRYYKVKSDSDGEPQKIVRYRAFADGNLLKEGS
jgi:hypothetical protein